MINEKMFEKVFGKNVFEFETVEKLKKERQILKELKVIVNNMDVNVGIRDECFVEVIKMVKKLKKMESEY